MKLIIAILFIFSSVLLAQELNCNVTTNMDNLSISDRDLLPGFAKTVADYLNKTRFSTNDWQNDKIDCTMTILLLTATKDGNFTAQVIVTSQRPVYQSNKTLQILRINDPTWMFTYQKGQTLYANQSTFDPLAGFLDYYANIIIGYNEDTWNQFGGTDYFNRAYTICNLATTSSFAKGWPRSTGTYSRQALAEDILSDKYRPFRDACYQLYYSIDYFENKKDDTKKAQDLMVGAINLILSLKNQIDFGSVVLRTFFDANSGEIVNYLKTYPDKTIFKSLKQIDPSHTTLYNAAESSN
jgi:hypothetical protein